MGYEKFLKSRICENCHFSILDPHPEEKYASLDHFKCKTCGFTKIIPKRIYDYIKKKYV